jgi:2',3'-cyclic-nucleotide 2'-phosphodiesterase (5'-nucleotidase family)
LLVSVEISGADVLAALEHGVARSPETDANFPHVSGLTFEFDSSLPPGSRVTRVEMDDGTPLNPAATYTIGTTEFLQAGGDGYTMLVSGANLLFFGGDAEAFAEYIAYLAR